jgi:hypothetical protein
MSFHPEQFRNMVLGTLEGFKPIPFNPHAVTLLLMTAAHESDLGTYLKQVRGPALGAWQMEPATLHDHLSWARVKRPTILEAVEGLRPSALTPEQATMTCLPYACVMARVHYFRRPELVPETLQGMAQWAKKVFNTSAGKATPEKYLDAYHRFYGEKP